MFRFFGGKGGVGKTTCAAATATGLARRGHRTLAISTDPAHSLGDVLGKRLSAKPQKVARNLDALELAADRALDRWLDARRDLLAEIADRGTWLDRADVERFLALSFPGVDELVALLEIARIAAEGEWDEVVVDTAPTGHTLRMLEMPATLERVASVLDAMQAKHRVIAQSLGGGRFRDAADALVEEIHRDAERLAAMLRDPERSSFHWVTAAETLALAEASDGVAALREGGIPVAELYVNRLTAKPKNRCALCSARHDEERARLDALAAPLAGLARIEIPDFEKDPLAGVEKAIFADAPRAKGAKRKKAAGAARATKRAGAMREGAKLPVEDRVHLVLVGGKGGVGKTTCAAALALEMARRAPASRILLLSIDPAHSLADALAQALSDEPLKVIGAPANLRARELDAPAAFLRFRDRYQGAVDELFDRMRGGSRFDASHDRAIVRDLLDLAPPGLDEIFAILAVVDALGLGGGPRAYDRVILDTAPTGHALRLLEMPERASAWVKTLLEVLLKYRGILRGAALAEDLIALSKGLRALRELLRDPARTAFVAVARPEPVVVAETERLVDALGEMGVPLRALVVNARTPAGGCSRCRAAMKREAGPERALAASTKAAIIHAPRAVTPPRGAEALLRFRGTWTAR